MAQAACQSAPRGGCGRWWVLVLRAEKPGEASAVGGAGRESQETGVALDSAARPASRTAAPTDHERTNRSASGRAAAVPAARGTGSDSDPAAGRRRVAICAV